MGKGKILVVSELLWPEGSGGELATSLFLRDLVKRGEDVVVYTATRKPSWLPQSSIIHAPYLKSSNKIELFSKLIMHRRELENLIKKSDVVYVPRYAYPVIPWAKHLGVKVVVHLHGYQAVSSTAVVLSGEHLESDILRTLAVEMRESNPLRAIFSTLMSPAALALIKKWIVYADTIICVSHRHREIISRYMPEISRKLEVVYNPLPDIPAYARRPSETPVFLYKGGDSYLKGFYDIIEALKILAKKGLRYKFIFTNKYSKHSLKKLLDLKRKYGIELEVMGRINHQHLLRLHQISWAVLFPSKWEEPLPYSVIEAAFMGVLPIASRVGGVPEILRGSYAERLLITPNCPRCLAEQIKYVASLSIDELITAGRDISSIISKRLDPKQTVEKLYMLLR